MAERMQDGGGTRVEQAERGEAKRVEGVEEIEGVEEVRNPPAPLTVRARLELASWMTVFATPAMVAAWLLWRAWWRQTGPQLTTLDGPGWLLAAATATLPTSRRHWGAAMAAELPQIPGHPARWRFAAGCARSAVLPPPAAGPR